MTLRPRYLCCHFAFGLALGMIRVSSRLGELHPMALGQKVVRL